MKIPMVDKIFQTSFNVNIDLWLQELLKRNNQRFGSNRGKESTSTLNNSVISD